MEHQLSEHVLLAGVLKIVFNVLKLTFFYQKYVVCSTIGQSTAELGSYSSVVWNVPRRWLQLVRGGRIYIVVRVSLVRVGRESSGGGMDGGQMKVSTQAP